MSTGCRNMFFFGLFLLAAWNPSAPAIASPQDDVHPTPEEILQQEGVQVNASSLIERIVNSHERLHIRYWAAIALGRTRDSSGIPALINLLKDNTTELRAAAAISLGKMGDASAIPYLKDALTDPKEVVRGTSVQALGDIGGSSAALALAEKVMDRSEPSDNIRFNAAFRLGLMKERIAIPHLLKAIHDSSLEVRTGAAVALGEMGDQGGVRVLVSTVTTQDAPDWLVVKAIEGLRKLTNEDFGYPKPYFARSTEEERANAIRKWSEWWQSNKHLYE